MRIAIASDHAGFRLKEMLKEYLTRQHYDITDFGTTSDEKSDYPDFAKQLASHVAAGRALRGILVCGTGIGMCIVANRFSGVRAAVLRTVEDALMSRRHNDANVACLGGRVSGAELARKLVDIFLTTGFDGGRHEVRVKKIDGGTQ